MRPPGSGGAPASAALPLLHNVPHCLRRGALQLPARRSERDPSYYSDRLPGAAGRIRDESTKTRKPSGFLFRGFVVSWLIPISQGFNFEADVDGRRGVRERANRHEVGAGFRELGNAIERHAT